MASTNPLKRPRASSSSSSDSDRVTNHARKRKRLSNKRRVMQRNLRVDQVDTSKSLHHINLDSTRYGHRATPPRLSISPSTPDQMTTILNKIDTLLTNNDYPAAYRNLRIILKDDDVKKAASNESLLKLIRFMQVLGDGKRQGMEQLRIINDARRREMELESELRDLRRKVARLP